MVPLRTRDVFGPQAGQNVAFQGLQPLACDLGGDHVDAIRIGGRPEVPVTLGLHAVGREQPTQLAIGGTVAP